jgi:glyoxylase-like metal-dependent hydrolase (beta-lactamase superfamily II)
MLVVNSAVGQVMDAMVYALSDDKSNDYYLIDIGDFDAAQSLLPREANVRGVFITHGHHDHIFGINVLKKAYPDCVVYASEECARMLASSKLNLSMYLETPMEYKGEVTILHDGDMVKLFEGINLTAIATPGHNPSCLCFIVDDYLFTGDSYIPGVKVVTNLPGGSKRQAQESVEKILELAEGKKVCSGHYAIQDQKLI